MRITIIDDLRDEPLTEDQKKKLLKWFRETLFQHRMATISSKDDLAEKLRGNHA